MVKYRYVVKHVNICLMFVFLEFLGLVIYFFFNFGFFLLPTKHPEDSSHFFSISNHCPHLPPEGEKLAGEEEILCKQA